MVGLRRAIEFKMVMLRNSQKGNNQNIVFVSELTGG